MVKNAASPKHRYIQNMVEQVAEDITPGSWQVKVFKEYKEDPYFRPDVRIVWSKQYGRKYHEVYVEVQKNLTEKSYCEKVKSMVEKDKLVPTFCFVEIREEIISDNWNEAYRQIRDHLEMAVPW